MAGDATKIPVLLTGDVYMFDPAVVYVSATHDPATISAALHAAWLPLGLMKGDPGVEQPRDIDKTDVPSWQQGRVLTRYKNGKIDANFNILERNTNVLKALNPTKVPRPVRTLLLFEYNHENLNRERYWTKAAAHIWIPADNRQEDVNGIDFQCSLYPVGQDIYTLQEGVPS